MEQMTPATKVEYVHPFFWVIYRCLNFIRRRFGTVFSIFKGGVSLITLPMKVEQTECSEM
jgi:hypothetical protein